MNECGEIKRFNLRREGRYKSCFHISEELYQKERQLISVFIERDGIGPNGEHSKKEDLGSQLGSIFQVIELSNN